MDTEVEDEFRPSKWKCNYCQSVMHSKWSGQFVQCKCGKSFVDITAFYMRKGGSVERCVS